MPLSCVLVACAAEPEGPPDPIISDWIFQILSISPASVYGEGVDEVTLKTAPPCAAADAELTVDAQKTPVRDGQNAGDIVFTPPAFQLNECESKRPVKVSLSCTVRGRRSVADAVLTIDPERHVAPIGHQHSPMNVTIPGDVAVVRVVISPRADAASVTAETFGIEGVSGVISVDERGREFTFTPASPLEPGRAFTAFATTGIRSICRSDKRLYPTTAPPGESVSPDADRWTFETFAATWIRPAITAKTPEPDATVGPDARCSATFDQDMDPEFFESAFGLVDGTERIVNGTHTYDAATRTATHTPATPLKGGRTYRCLARGSNAMTLDGESVARTVAGAWMRESASWLFHVRPE